MICCVIKQGSPPPQTQINILSFQFRILPYNLTTRPPHAATTATITHSIYA